MERSKDSLELLDSVKNQGYPHIETIVVVERLQELLGGIKRYAAEDARYPIRVVFNFGEPGLSASRNIGISEAKGDIIAFADDDVVLTENWAEEMAKTYEDQSIIGVTGEALPLWQNGNARWLPKEFYWIIGCTAWSHCDRITDVRNVWGMNISFRRGAFDMAGGFSHDIGGLQGKRIHGEEVELSERIKKVSKKRIVYNPEVRVHHKVYKYRLMPRYIAKTSYWIGYTRQSLKRMADDTETKSDILYVEHRLLRNIVTEIPLDILKTCFCNPLAAFRKVSVTIIALSSVAYGYYFNAVEHFLRSLISRKK
jgi:glycosyltransferase involved in cell wall biosynthesis